jgi:hypothetical protein
MNVLGYSNQQFNQRMLATPEGKCHTCGAATLWDTDGYTSTCGDCFDRFHQGKAIEHSHMFTYPEGYVQASGVERLAWPTTVDMRPAFVSGEQVGWFCAGGHGSEPCGWQLTVAEAQPLLDKVAQRVLARAWA